MTDFSQHDREQLEQATTRMLPADVFPAGAPPDAETASQRDGWLALGQAVDAANAGFREEELLARLLAEERARADAPTATVSLATPRQAVAGWQMLLTAALALTMIVAVVRTVLVGVGDQGGSSGNPAVTVSPAPEQPNTEQPAVDRPAVGAANTETSVAWSDPLDDEIDQAAQRVQTLVAQSTGFDASLDGLSERLQSMSEDLLNGSL